MIVLISGKHLRRLLLFSLLVGLGAALWYGAGRRSAPAFSSSGLPAAVVVVDPGHGGEDGGAVSADGTVESGVNLAVALRVNILLRFAGQDTVMTRSEDAAIYSQDAATLRQKKVSDLKNRAALVNSTPGAVLLSIHQNCLPDSPRVHGAQVFYNRAEGGAQLADSLQNALNQTVNLGNEKKCKAISPAIYLLKTVTAPAVIVECGFLSSREETALLCQPEYQLRLAAAITAGYLNSGASPAAAEEQP